MSIELGQKAKDPITGFEGIAIGRTTWLYGCSRIALQAVVDKDGKVPDPQWFDELQLESVEPKRAKEKGGPRPTPQRKPDPNR